MSKVALFDLARMCGLIWIAEVSFAMRVLWKYRNKDGSELLTEEFLGRCTPEDLYQLHCHSMMAMFMMMLGTIFSAMLAAK